MTIPLIVKYDWRLQRNNSHKRTTGSLLMAHTDLRPKKMAKKR